MKFTNITYPNSSFNLYYYVYVLRAVESCQNITEGQTSCDICKTTLYKVFKKLPIFSSFTADRRRRRHRVASSGRRVAPPWPRRMVGWPVCLQRLAGTDPVSLQSWSVQRARGRPGRLSH